MAPPLSPAMLSTKRALPRIVRLTGPRPDFGGQYRLYLLMSESIQRPFFTWPWLTGESLRRTSRPNQASKHLRPYCCNTNTPHPHTLTPIPHGTVLVSGSDARDKDSLFCGWVHWTEVLKNNIRLHSLFCGLVHWTEMLKNNIRLNWSAPADKDGAAAVRIRHVSLESGVVGYANRRPVLRKDAAAHVS